MTSRQSLQSVFEQRSIGAEALRKPFEQLLVLLEELGQYKPAPDGLVLQPELVFADANLENFSLLLSAGKAGTHRLFSEADPGADGISAAEAGSPRSRMRWYSGMDCIGRFRRRSFRLR